jgi:hypothetical protein
LHTAQASERVKVSLPISAEMHLSRVAYANVENTISVIHDFILCLTSEAVNKSLEMMDKK